jgi:DNA helicase IV
MKYKGLLQYISFLNKYIYTTYKKKGNNHQKTVGLELHITASSTRAIFLKSFSYRKLTRQQARITELTN